MPAHRTHRTHRLTIVSTLMFALVAVLFTLPSFVINGQEPSDPAIEADVIAKLNAWRMSEGVAPLKFNADLQQLALKQAQYLVGLSVLPEGGELHRDSFGQLPPERAYAAKWPSYGISSRTDVGENAAVGDAKFALHYWLHSEIHKKTALNPAYREVGVAALKYHKSYMIIADFGARPDYLPVFLFPEEGDLYFTSEQYRWKSGGQWVQNVSQVELLDANGKPLVAKPIKFANKIPIPPLTTDTFEIVYHDGKAVTRYEANIKDDVVILPHHLKAAEVTLQASSPKSTVPPTVSKLAVNLPPTNTPRHPAALPTNTPRNAATKASTPTTAPTKKADPTEAVGSILEVDRGPEILITYDDTALVVVNDTDKPADISGLKIRYQGHILEAGRWAKVVPIVLNGFPVDHCLMLEVTGGTGFLPEECTSLRSVISVPAERQFWRQDSFDVLRGDTVVATCAKGELHGDDHCEVPWQ